MDKTRTVLVEENEKDPSNEQPWVSIKVSLYEDRSMIGNMRLSFIPRAAAKDHGIETDILAYLKVSCTGNARIVPPAYSRLELAGESMVSSIEYGINEALLGWLRATKQRERILTREERIENIKKSLPALEARLERRRIAFLTHHIDRPVVDGVWISEDQKAHEIEAIQAQLVESATEWVNSMGLDPSGIKAHSFDGCRSPHQPRDALRSSSATRKSRSP